MKIKLWTINKWLKCVGLTLVVLIDTSPMRPTQLWLTTIKKWNKLQKIS